MPYYWANARELTDDGGFNPVYGNPSSFDYSTPRIYFQPLTLLMGLFAWAGISPGLGFVFIGLVGAAVCGRFAIALYDRFGGSEPHARLSGLISFFWGGGLLVAAGVIAVAARGGGLETLFKFDPFEGWWFQNFGRNLVFPTEAIYHAIFFGAILLILAGRFAAALAAMTLMSVSHPFTGLQLLLIVIAWSGLELILRSRTVPIWFIEATALLAVAHLGYYLVFLNRFPDHRELQDQWTLRWVIGWQSLLLANVLVGSLALWRLRTRKRATDVLAQPENRLLVVWFIISVLLAKHEAFVPQPVQPVHFTRGYQWIPLFLLGLPVLTALLARIKGLPRRALVLSATTGFVLLAFGDNAAWLTARTMQALRISVMDRPLKPLGIALTTDELQLLRWLKAPANRGSVVASQADTIGYLVTTYTPLRSWRSHIFNTPSTLDRDEELDAFFEEGRVPAEWKKLRMLIVFREKTDWRARLGVLQPGTADVVFNNGSFVVARSEPRTGLPTPEVLP